MQWLLILLALVALALLGAGLHIALTMRWLARETRYDAYFKRPLADRRALKTEVAKRSRRVIPLLRALPRWLIPKAPTRVRDGIHLPKMICPRSEIERAVSYRPVAGDIFIATQMKCGTTWAQQIAYEILMRGRGDLAESGRHMYAISPWIESSGAVRFEQAERIGPEQSRIIKTHLPASLCPYSEAARYIYVARHPVACFSSAADFTQLLGGPFSLDRAASLDWYCSDEMWWGSWATHVGGWWQQAESRPNVLFLHYEDMLEDLGAAVDQVSALLGVQLQPEERARVVEKSGYPYMKRNEDVFEMAAPTLFSEGGTFFVSGKGGNERGATPAESARIGEFCRRELSGAAYPLARRYPDVARK
jgi:aryl sulfotransferase